MLLALAAPARAARAPEAELARAVRATFLYKFAAFVEWPETAFATTDEPLRICVVGDEEFGRLVERGAAGQRLGEREILVEILDEFLPGIRCHALYLGGPTPPATALAAVRGLPVLTATDETEDRGARGIVRFVLREERVRFEIDKAQADEARLRINPKVLELAVRVHP